MRARHGARALCIVVLRTVSDPEGSSTKGEHGECRRLPGLHDGLVLFPVPLPTSHLNHQDTKRTKVSPRVLDLTFGIPGLVFHRCGSGSTDQPGIPETKDFLGVLGTLVVNRAVGQEQALGQRQPIIDPNLSKMISAA